VVAGTEPADSFVARCDCGSDANSRTETIGAEPFRFHASEYQAAVLGQGEPPAWEPVTRQACVLATSRLTGSDLASSPVGFSAMS
jgi:hypothetical protein